MITLCVQAHNPFVSPRNTLNTRKVFLIKNILCIWCFLWLQLVCSAAPEISVNKRVLDFKKFPANKQQSATIKLENKGNEPLEIVRIRKTCGCSIVTPESNTIAPDCSTNVIVIIIPNALKGVFSKKIFIETNDPRHRFTVISMKGEAIPRVTVSPTNRIYPPRLQLNKKTDVEFTLKKMQTSVVFGKPTTTCNYPIEAKLAEIDADTVKVIVSITPQRSEGKLAATISVPTSTDGGNIVKLYVSADVGPALYAIPSRIKVPKYSRNFETSVKLKFVGIDPATLEQSKIGWLSIDGLQVTPGTLDGDSLPICFELSKKIIHDLSKGEKELNFTYPGALPAKCRISL